MATPIRTVEHVHGLAMDDPESWMRLAVHAQAAASALQPPGTQAQARASAKKPGAFTRLLNEVVNRRREAWHTLWHPLDTLKAWLAQVFAPRSEGSPVERGTPQAAFSTPREHSPQTPVRSAATTTPTIDTVWTQAHDTLWAAAKDPAADPATVGAQLAQQIPPEHRAAIAERLQALATMARETAQALQPKSSTPSQAVSKAPKEAKKSEKSEKSADPNAERNLTTSGRPAPPKPAGADQARVEAESIEPSSARHR